MDTQRTTTHVRILRLPEVIHRTGLRRSSIYLAIDQGRFPRPVSIGQRSVGWISDDIDDWIMSRAREKTA